MWKTLLAELNRGVELAEEKSVLVKFNRWEPESSGKFTFVPSGPAGWLRIDRRRYRARGSLGFDFYWHKSRLNPNYRVVKRSTNAKKFGAALAKLKDWLKKSRSLPLPEIIATLKRKLLDYWNYYGVIGNSEETWKYAWFARKLVYNRLNRLNRRKSLKRHVLRGGVGALANARAAPGRGADAKEPLDKASQAPYEQIRQQETNRDRSSTCAHS